MKFQTFIQRMIGQPLEWLESLPSSIAEQGVLAAFIGVGHAAAFFGIQALSELCSDFESMMRSQSFEGLFLDAESPPRYSWRLATVLGFRATNLSESNPS